RVDDRDAELVEVVDDHEEGDDHDAQERDPARVAGLPHDLRRALRGQAGDVAYLAWGREPLGRARGSGLRRLAACRQPPLLVALWAAAGLVGHTQPTGLFGGLIPGGPAAIGSGPWGIVRGSGTRVPPAG